MDDEFDTTWDQISNAAIMAVMMMAFMAALMPTFIKMIQPSLSSGSTAALSYQGSLNSAISAAAPSIIAASTTCPAPERCNS